MSTFCPRSWAKTETPRFGKRLCITVLKASSRSATPTGCCSSRQPATTNRKQGEPAWFQKDRGGLKQKNDDEGCVRASNGTFFKWFSDSESHSVAIEQKHHFTKMIHESGDSEMFSVSALTRRFDHGNRI